MSAVPATRPTPTIERPQARPTVRTRPVSTPELRTRPNPVPVRPVPRTRTQARTRPSVVPKMLARTLGLSVVALAAFSVSSLSGHVMVEKARGEGIRAAERARVARNAESGIRQRVDALTTEPSIEKWALANGFRAPDDVEKPGNGKDSRVASLR